MPDPYERYVKLGLKECLPRIHQYPLACKELSFILRHAYSKLPKNLHSLLFQDTLFAFRLLPEMQTQNSISAANLLSRSAEASLPRHKRALAIAEFKRAKVAFKRRCKSQLAAVSVSDQLPHDVLIHIFSFLDLQSLVSAALVCWSWTFAASEDSIWRRQFYKFFGNYDKDLVIKDQKRVLCIGDGFTSDYIDWRNSFKNIYLGNSTRKVTSDRGYCKFCEEVVWLNYMKCTKNHSEQESQQQIIPLSPQQLVAYILDGNLAEIAASDGESDSDDEYSVSKLWVY